MTYEHGDAIWNAYQNVHKDTYSEQVQVSAKEAMDYYEGEFAELCVGCPADYGLPNKVIEKITDMDEEWFVDTETEICAANWLCRFGALEDASDWDEETDVDECDSDAIAEEITQQFISAVVEHIVAQLESQRQTDAK